MEKRIAKVLIEEQEIKKMVARLGAQITQDYAGKELVLIGILKGGFTFLADLARAVDLPLQIDFMAVSSYGLETKTSGVVKITRDADLNISGKHVIVVEDIIDTGLTLNKLMEILSTRNPASLAICAAFDKPSRRKIDLKAKYTGIEVPDEFIVGYGLDYANYYRNLPNICVLEDNI